MTQNNKLFVGRAEEKHVLDAALKSKTSEFIAIYGRRRVGKTYLVKHVFQYKEAIFFYISGTKDAPMAEQIQDFTEVLEELFYQNTISIKPPRNWKAAFSLLTKTIQREAINKTVIVFFDELPWLAGRRSRFIQALDYFWNRHWVDMNNLKLIVCGSAASWMLDNVISHHGGLHNRITGQIGLSPFDLKETKAFLQAKSFSYTDEQILAVYMVTGGIPYYLNFLKRNLSVPQNIDLLCFQRKGLLVDEFNRLYSSLFQDTVSYEELIRIMANRRNGIERTKILKLSKYSSDGGGLKKKLDALEQSGFIVSFTPYGSVKKGIFYRIIDEYSLFYLHWIEPALSTIRKLDKTKGYWVEKSQSPSWRAWAGYAFESVCYKHLDKIRASLQISASADVRSWQWFTKKGGNELGAQIDLLFDRHDDVITICEIKYTTQPYQLSKEDAQNLMNKIEVFKKHTNTKKQTQLVLITNQPIKETMYSEALIVQNITLKDLK